MFTVMFKEQRVCDRCRRRKIKCINEGTNSCKNCVSTGSACTNNAIPKTKGRWGMRGEVLSELQENQRNTQLTTGLTHELGFDPRLVGTFARTPGLLPMGLIESCLEFFFANVYPSQPILHRQRAQETVMSIEHSTEAYCMIVALCAYVMIQANMTVPPELLPRSETAQPSNISMGHVLVEEAIRVRKGLDYLENPSYLSVLTSWFFYSCQFGLGRDNFAWSYLRCATTQAQLLGWHDEEAYKSDLLNSTCKRVLYWLLYVAERTHALHKHRPTSLFPTINTPCLDDVPNEGPIASGLNMLINLYKPVDDTFVNVWKDQTHANLTWIAQVQNQLLDALPNLPLPRSLNIPPLGSDVGLSPNSLGEVSSLASVTSLSYPSTELIHQSAAQAVIEDLSLYDSAPHSIHSSSSTPASQTGTPGPNDLSQPRSQLPTQRHGHPAHTIPSSHPQPATIQSHQLGITTAAYDSRFTSPGFPGDPSMVFKHDAFTDMNFDDGLT